MRLRFIVLACASTLLLLSCSAGHKASPADQWRPRDGSSSLGKVENTKPKTAESHAKAKPHAKKKHQHTYEPSSAPLVRSNDRRSDQHDNANPKASSENWNDTWQTLLPTQRAEDLRSEDGTFNRSEDDDNGKDGHTADGASQTGVLSDKTSQHGSSDTKTMEVNATRPISVSSVGNHGDVNQSNTADTQAKSETNGSETSHDPDDGTAQSGKVEHPTEHDAQSSAETTQPDLNAPTAEFGVDSNNSDDNGDLNEGKVVIQATLEHGGETSEHADPSQQVEPHNPGSHDGCGPVRAGHDSHHKRADSNPDGQDAASQSGKVDNESDQSASADAETTQFNQHAPISSFSAAGNNGDLKHGNGANDQSHSSNGNGTGQSLRHHSTNE